jgi:hypothetical protein
LNAFRILLAVAAWPFEEKEHVNPVERKYFSPRYRKWLTVERKFKCDAATWAPNIGISWLFHDKMFATGKWDDGTPIKWREANRVMQDIQELEGLPKWVRKLYRKGIKSKWSYKAWCEKRKVA